MLTVATTGRIGIKHLKEHIPEFTRDELNEARNNLVANRILIRNGRTWALSMEDPDDGLEWVLAGAVACGFVETVKEGSA
jgi:hypothetical protein